MSLIETERQTYEAMWGLDAYAASSPGALLVPVFEDAITHHGGGNMLWRAASVLDAGCGSGRGALALQAAGFKVTMCDLTPAGLVSEAYALPFHQVVLWEDLRRTVGYHDYVYCCDVLEHVPPPFAMLVISRLLEVARRGVFLSISLVHDQFGAYVGKPLHQNVQGFTQWRDQLATMGEVLEARDLLIAGAYLVKPR